MQMVWEVCKETLLTREGLPKEIETNKRYNWNGIIAQFLVLEGENNCTLTDQVNTMGG